MRSYASKVSMVNIRRSVRLTATRELQTGGVLKAAWLKGNFEQVAGDGSSSERHNQIDHHQPASVAHRALIDRLLCKQLSRRCHQLRTLSHLDAAQVIHPVSA